MEITVINNTKTFTRLIQENRDTQKKDVSLYEQSVMVLIIEEIKR